MKYLAILLFVSCSQSAPSSLGYDSEKDKWLSEILSTKPEMAKKDSLDKYHEVYYTLTYHDIQIYAVHECAVPFQSKDDWDFFSNKRDGSIVMIQSTLGIAEHNVAPKTLERIKSICLSL